MSLNDKVNQHFLLSFNWYDQKIYVSFHSAVSPNCLFIKFSNLAVLLELSFSFSQVLSVSSFAYWPTAKFPSCLQVQFFSQIQLFLQRNLISKKNSISSLRKLLLYYPSGILFYFTSYFWLTITSHSIEHLLPFNWKFRSS